MNRREFALEISLIIGLGVWASAEALSAFGALHVLPLWGAWLMIAVGATGFMLRRVRTVGGFRFSRVSVSMSDSVFVSFIGLLLGSTLLTALFAAPGNWDSMTYHLARVAHWASQGSLRHYATEVERQLAFSPWAEIAIAEFQILVGSDRLANLVQWLAYAGSISVVSLIVKRASGSLESHRARRAQLLAALLVATIPMAVLQASSTQNDLVGAYWLAVFAYCAFTVRPLAGAAALGLATFSKGTAYFFGAPIAIWMLLRARRRSGRLPIGEAILLAAIPLLINGPHFARNFSVFHHPLQSAQLRAQVAPPAPSIGGFIANFAENAVVHLGTPSSSFNEIFAARVAKFAASLGVRPGEAGAYKAAPAFEIPRFDRDEDTAGNPLHFALILLFGIAGAVAVMRGRAKGRGLRGLAWSLFAGYILLALMLSWQATVSRLETPLFVLACAPLALAFDRVPRRVGQGILLLLVLMAIPCAILNRTRPLLQSEVREWRSVLVTPRESQMFAKRRNLEAAYRELAAHVTTLACRDVGLIASGESWEYPLWVLAPGVRFRDVDVSNDSRVLEDPVPPCAIVRLSTKPGTESGPIRVHGHEYRREWQHSTGQVALFR